MEAKEQLIQRWDSFLLKMKQRYLESLDQAKEACLSQLEETDYDYYTVMRSWGGMVAQVQLLIPKIDETWEEKVEPQMEALNSSDYFYLDEGKKTSELTDELHMIMMRFHKTLEGELSQKYYNHVMEVSTKNFNCSQCSAPITIQKNVFRAQYLTCQSCNSVNTFEPDTKFMQIGGTIIDNIVALKCVPLKDEMEKIYDEIHQLRRENHTDEVWAAYKTAYFMYWETFFKERILLKSDTEERYEADMERKKVEFVEFENTQRHNKYGEA